ncbi:hypothetical protein [Candidatus Methylacidithermus pantelleriae]|uniref:Uncharacterized protein n=1 Tax=Candidatus Methylacidithermus pantelleriae TaxID=2744239 RepID=A0A8J2BSI4_9BACT|nr:hypothetical protein [Candidatus Methylacidithermus pantelleriae]CAF0695394.1 hypothetical protein MPNT_190027 [Candidatus Methylacidithermus pantelleriae]
MRRLHARVATIPCDAIDRATTILTRIDWGIGTENPNVEEVARNWHLRRPILDGAFLELCCELFCKVGALQEDGRRG